jgi:outer membrane protein W
MKKSRTVLLLSLAVIVLAGTAAAQDQRFAIRFGLNLVEPTSDTTIEGENFKLDTKSGGEFGFEWYFHPRVGFEVATTGSANAEIKTGGDEITGGTFSTFTLGINGHVIRSEKVDFALGLLAGRAAYGDFEVDGSTTRIDLDADTTYGVQAFVDMTVSRKWAVDVGIKYLQTQLDLATGETIDYNPVMLRVMGVYRWGQAK